MPGRLIQYKEDSLRSKVDRGEPRVQSVLSIITTIILARLLQPEDFGLLAMATIFTVLIGFFAEFGSGSAVVQKQEIGQEEFKYLLVKSLHWDNNNRHNHYSSPLDCDVL